MKIVYVLFLVMLACNLKAQVLVMTDETTEIKFVARHLAGRLEGDFKGAKGTAKFDAANLSTSYFKLLFAAATVTTNDNFVGPNLITTECFNPAKYPNIELSSSSFKKLQGQNEYQFTGQLKIKGKSKNITFPMTVTQNAGGYDFKFAFSFLKKAFDLQCGAMGKDFKILVSTYGKKS